MQMTSAGHHDRRPEPEKPTAAQKRALEEIIALHERWVRSVVLAVTGRPDEVDDVTQQVWVPKGGQHVPSLKAPEACKTETI